MASGIELIRAVSPLKIVNNLEDVASMLVLALREINLFVSFDVVQQVVINWLEGLIEDLKMVSC